MTVKKMGTYSFCFGAKVSWKEDCIADENGNSFIAFLTLCHQGSVKSHMMLLRPYNIFFTFGSLI